MGYKSLNPKYYVNCPKISSENEVKVFVSQYIGHKNNFVKIGLHGYQKIPCHMYCRLIKVHFVIKVSY
jgi:hypothetical protein